MNDLERRKRRAADLKGTRERREFTAAVEIRDAGTVGADGPTLEGLASAYGREYEVGDPSRGGWVEIIKPGAARRTLGEDPDVVLNLQHGQAGSGLPLARTKARTLTLSETEKGLHVRAKLDPEDPETISVARKMERGDLDGAISFAFKVTADSWSDDFSRREIQAFSLAGGDVSLVVHGANPHAMATLRSANERSVQDRLRKLRIQHSRERDELFLLQHKHPGVGQ